MTAKQALLDRVQSLSDEEAEELLAQLDWDATATESLTDAEWAEVREAERAFARGEGADGEEVLAGLGFDRAN